MYLNKKIQYSWIGDWLLKTQENIDCTIKRHHENRKIEKYNGAIYETSLYRELISYIDFSFLARSKNSSDDSDMDDLNSYSNEAIASAVSFLIFRYKNVIGIPKDNGWIDAGYVASDEMNQLILMACKFSCLREWELFWDYYNYSVSDDGIIYSEDEFLEKSIRLGYINTQIQEQLFITSEFNALDKENWPTLQTYGEMLEKHKDVADVLIILFGYGIFERYAVKNYEEFFNFIGAERFGENVTYREEVVLLNYMSKELVVPINKLLKWKVTANATMHDVLLFQRFFRINKMHYEYILKNYKNYNAMMRSMGNVIEIDSLINMLNTQINNKQVTKELIDFFTYKSGRLDLQYTPLMKLANNYCCPTMICAISNFINNVISYSYQTQQNREVDSTGESLEKVCQKAFENSTTACRVLAGCKYSYGGSKGEIDLLVIYNDALLFIECKNPILPTDAFSMRNNYDYIKKAAKQLANMEKAFSNIIFQTDFLNSHSIEYRPREILSCIVMGNRLFSGYCYQGYPVRCIHELISFLVSGDVNYVCDDQIIKEHLWEEKNLSLQDIKKYLSGEKCPTKIIQLDKMSPYIKTMNCGNHIIGFKSYKLLLPIIDMGFKKRGS